MNLYFNVLAWVITQALQLSSYDTCLVGWLVGNAAVCLFLFLDRCGGVGGRGLGVVGGW